MVLTPEGGVVHYDLMLSAHMVPCNPAPMHPLKQCQCQFVTATPAPYRAPALVQMCTRSSGAKVYWQLWCKCAPKVLVQMRTGSSGANAHQKCKDFSPGANAHQMIQGNASLPLSAHFPTTPSSTTVQYAQWGKAN